MRVVDLRSDTKTRPTPEMRHAMATAEVGDDMAGEDPTVNRLEAMAADMLGKEAAVYVSSGTQGNLVGILAQCQRGDEVIAGDRSHIMRYEFGGASVLGGVVMTPVPNDARGMIDPEQVDAAIHAGDRRLPSTKLVALENTHNTAGGIVLTAGDMESIAEVTAAHGISLHLDGARLFNAAVALGVSVSELTRKFDSVTFCVSKGLGAPVGSLLMGAGEYIQQARLQRKILGGGMRQAGVIAAAGLIALEDSPERLHIDHENAQALARGLAQVPGIGIDLSRVETNILILNVAATGMTSGEIAQRLAAHSVRVHAMNPSTIRMVTHCDVTGEDCERAVAEMADVVSTDSVAEKISG